MKPAAIGMAVCSPKGPQVGASLLQVQVRSLAAPKRLAGPHRVPCKETKGAGLGTLGFRGTQACSVLSRRRGKVSNSCLLAVPQRLDAALGRPSCTLALRPYGAPCLGAKLWHLLPLHALFALCSRAHWRAQGKHLEVLQRS